MIREEAARAAAQLFEVAKMKEGELLVVGCSSSEIGAEKIGTHSSAEIGQAVFEGIKESWTGRAFSSRPSVVSI